MMIFKTKIITKNKMILRTCIKFCFIICIVYFLLGFCSKAFADDQKRFIKKFLEVARYYGLSGLYPVIEDIYPGDVFIISPKITKNTRYTVIYINSLLDRTNPYTYRESNCFLKELKNYQLERPIVIRKNDTGQIPDITEFQKNVFEGPNSPYKQGDRSKILEDYWGSSGGGGSSESKKIENNLTVTVEVPGGKKEDCKPCTPEKPKTECDWNCAENKCPFTFEAKNAAFPSIEIGKNSLDYILAIFPIKLLLFTLTFEWHRSHYQLYHFPDVELLSFPFNKFKCLMPQYINKDNFLTITGGLTPTEIVNLSCGLDFYANTTACKAITGRRKESQIKPYETLAVEFRIPFVIYYTKSVVVEDTRRKSIGLRNVIEATNDSRKKLTTVNVRQSKEGVSLIRNFDTPVAIASKNLRYTFLFTNVCPDKFDNWYYTGQINMVR